MIGRLPFLSLVARQYAREVQLLHDQRHRKARKMPRRHKVIWTAAAAEPDHGSTRESSCSCKSLNPTRLPNASTNRYLSYRPPRRLPTPGNEAGDSGAM